MTINTSNNKDASGPKPLVATRNGFPFFLELPRNPRGIAGIVEEALKIVGGRDSSSTENQQQWRPKRDGASNDQSD
jgi:hypothetical protein